MRKKLLLGLCALFMLSITTFAQTTATGKVVDEKGAAISGATVLEKGTKNGTSTSSDGSYSIKVKSGAKLVIKAVGYGDIEVSAGSGVKSSLVAQSGNIDEVVVTALGIRRNKNTLPYAAQQVAGDEVSKQRSNNFVNGLSGKISGLQITQNNAIGGSTNVVIRGFKSLTGNNQALFVIDGVPVDNGNTNNRNQVNGRGGYDYGNAAADINPDDIESVNVLKGAAASALYGSRAGNGVILITTKKGRKGLGISINSGVTFGSLDKSTFPKYQKQYGAGYGSANGYGSPDGNFFYFDVNGDGVDDLVTPTTEDASWGAKFDPSLKVYQWNAFDKTSQYYKKATPWVAAANDPSEYFEKPVSFNNSVFIEGGDDKATFKLGYTRNNEKGLLPNSKIDKDLLNLGASYKVSDKMTAAAAINYSSVRGLGRYGTGYDPKNPMNSFRQWWEVNNDILELRDAYFRTKQNTTWNWSDPTTAAGLKPIYWNNPYWDRYENYQNDSRSRYQGNVSLSYAFTKNLSVLGRISLDSYDEIHEERNAIGSIGSYLSGGDPNGEPSGYSRLNRSYREYNYDLLVNYDKNINKNLNLKALAGGNIRKTSTSSILASTNGGLVVPKLYSLSNSLNPIGAPTESEVGLQVNGIFAGFTLTWKEMLILDATGRNDVSSTLPTNNNSYFYPAVSGGFVFSKLLKDMNWLSYGKLRTSYAELGNSAPAQSLKDVYTKPDPYGTATLFAIPATKNNPNLKPERTKSFEIGLEMNFLKNRVGFDLTYYNSKSIDQILPVAVSTSTGYDTKYVNAGVMQNKGIELSLFGTPVKTRDFSWDVRVNWTKNNNTVVSLFSDSAILQLNTANLQGGVSVNAVPGQPYGEIRGDDYIYTNGQPTVKSNGWYAKTTTTNNRIGNATPDWTGGISNTFRYKNVALSFLVDVKQGGQLFSLDMYYGLATGLYPETAGLNDLGNPVRNSLADGGGIILPGVMADGKTNTIRKNISTLFGAYGYYRNPARAFVYDASYVKLRELSITYSFPKKLLSKVPFIKGLDFSIFGRNLWIIHKNVPYSDPEDLLSSGNVQGYQSGAYPTTRTIGFNFNFKL